MNIGFYDPYFDGAGGGERYTLTLASHWSRRHSVSLFWDDESVIKLSEKRFGIDLSRVKTVQNIFRKHSLPEKLITSRKYDLIFFLTDGSIPMSLAHHNILHIQVPFPHITAPFYKMARYDAVVCNSVFTKNTTDPHIGRSATVIYPPVDVAKFNSGRKTKTILSVGRFSSLYQAKKQEVLIAAFREGIASGVLTGYTLALAGGLLESDTEYYSVLRKAAAGYPITFFKNVSFDDLRTLYSKSLIYWHAAGFGEIDPVRMEHFGISTVEAMKSGCVPVVYDGGGQGEIVEEGKNGYLFRSIPELLEKTGRLLRNPDIYREFSRNALKKSMEFSTDRFCHAYDELLERIIA